MIFYIRRICQYNFSDSGIVQKQLIALLVLLLMFNEPFYFSYALSGYKMMSTINTGVQASFVAMLLYFWLFIIDASSKQDQITESASKFYLPKLLLSGVIWCFLLIALSNVRVHESQNPLIGWESTTTDMMGWVLVVILVLYGVYLATLVSKVFKTRLPDSFKFVIGITVAVMILSLSLLILVGLQNYISTSASVLEVLAIEALLNLYIYLIAYLYSPSAMSHESMIKHQKENEHRKIISQLYEQELPEMPTMRDEQSNYTSKNEYDIPDQDIEAKRRQSDPDQIKRNKIWEEIEKEAEDEEEDGEEDKDSDANESDPDIEDANSEDSEDSDKDNK